MDEKMVDKKVADNKISKTDQIKNQIKAVDNSLESSYDALKSIDEMEDAFNRLNKNLGRVVDLLNKSVKGKNIAQRLDDIKIDNQKIYKSSVYELDIRRENTRKEIEEFESIKEEYRKKLKEEEDAKKELDKKSDVNEAPQTV